MFPHPSLSGVSTQTQRTQRIYATYEFTQFPNLRKLQPTGTELSSIQVMELFIYSSMYPAELKFLRFKLKKSVVQILVRFYLFCSL